MMNENVFPFCLENNGWHPSKLDSGAVSPMLARPKHGFRVRINGFTDCGREGERANDALGGE